MDSGLALYLGVVTILASGLVALWIVTIRAVQRPANPGQHKGRRAAASR